MFCYIHIPFCTQKCEYCRFASYAGIDKLKVNFYVDFLCQEIEKSQTCSEKLQSVYFGGGTPSMLSSKQLEKIIQTLKKKYGLKDDIEINLETTPENVDLNSVNEWKDIGVNRLSMGVQSLNDKTLKEIGREPTAEIYGALEALDTGIIQNVSIDFIIGLPFVGKGELQKYISQVLEKYKIIKHVSVYMLEDYYEIPEEQDSKFQGVTYPVNWSKDGLGEAEFLEEYLSIKDYLNEQGLNAYEISNFAKRGYECQHNMAYWDHSEVLAFGLGASGFKSLAPSSLHTSDEKILGYRYKNSESFKEYYAGNDIQVDELRAEDILLEKIMFGLRTSGFDTQYLGMLDQEAYKRLRSDGLLTKKNQKIILGRAGYTLLDSIIGELIT